MNAFDAGDGLNVVGPDPEARCLSDVEKGAAFRNRARGLPSQRSASAETHAGFRQDQMTSLSRPGGDITGVANLNVELGPKKLELLHRLVPTATVIGLLVNRGNPNNEIRSKDMEAAARILGLEVDTLRASTEREIDGVFARLLQARAGALALGVRPGASGLSRARSVTCRQ